MTPSNELNSRHQIRSFSLPSKSHPINKRIEEELERLRLIEESSKSPAETISIGLYGLADLYLCINQALSLPLTQQALSLRQHEKCVGELLKQCSNLRNVSSTAREILLRQSKLIRNLQSALSTLDKGSNNYESKMASYICSRKEIINQVKPLILSLKQQTDDGTFGPSRLLEEEDNRFLTVTKALRCVSIINISVYESLLSYLSVPVSKQKSGSLVSKLIQKGKSKIIHQAKRGNALKDVETTMCSGLNKERSQIAHKSLEDLVDVIECIRNGLDSVYMQLTETKASLMNIVSF